MRIKIDPLDTLFSRYIRTKAKWTCERCHAVYHPPTASLQNSHYHGRRMKSVRFDPDNCDSLCYGCHQFFGEHREDYTNKYGEKVEGYTSWKRKKLGDKRFDLLTLRANTPNKPDRELIKLFLKKELQYLLGVNS